MHHNTLLQKLQFLLQTISPLLLALISTNVSATENLQSKSVDGNLGKIATVFNHRKTIKGGFKQTRLLQGISRPIVSSGVFIYWKNQGIYWETSQPFFHANTFTPWGITHWQSKGVAAQSPLNRPRVEVEVSRILLSIFSADLKQIKRRFFITASGDEKNWSLTLTPSNAILKQILNKITVAGGHFIEKVNIVSVSGDTTRIGLHNPQTDRALTAGECRFFVPTASKESCAL